MKNKAFQRDTKPAYHHGDLAQALTTAARDILETQGLAKLSLRAAARQAGVSQAAPYHHFKDKEALLASVAAQGFRAFDAAMTARMAAAGDDPEARLTASGVAYVKFATDNPALFRLMFGSTIEDCENYPELTEAGARAYQSLEENIRASLSQTGGNPATAPLKALSAWCSVHGLATLLIDGGLDLQQCPTQSVTELTEMILTAAKK